MKKLTRNALLQWLTEALGMTNAQITMKTGQERRYVSERMRQYELRGYVRRVMTPNPMGPEIICWYLNEATLQKKGRAAQVLARQIEAANSRHEALKEQAVKAEVVQRVCKAPRRDAGIVRTALAARPAIEAVWRPGQ